MAQDNELICGYKDFLAKGKTERECVAFLVKEAEKNGYKNIDSLEKVKAGDKVYLTKFGKAIALFDIGSDGLEKGMNILGAHIDSPRLDVKQNPVYESDFIVYLNTHYYGGIKKYQWLTLPLAIHGVVCKKDGSTVNVCIGEKEDDPVFVISDILPHLAQKQMKETAAEFIPGETLDLILGSEIPLDPSESSAKADKADKSDKPEKDKAKKAVLKLLKDAYNIEEKDFGSAELEVVPAGLPRDLGLDRSMILAYGQDDRSCAYTSAYALFNSKAEKRTNCCLCVDKEEIGSVGATGMASH
ncbi:MAG: aminopeptidase, partial [Treponema sp.]|nr:aminopeptidase [Treponema sp.]